MTLGGRNAEAVRHVEAALADGSPPEPERAELLAWGALAVFPVDPGLAQTWAQEAKDAAERAGHDPAVCIALTALSGSALAARRPAGGDRPGGQLRAARVQQRS